MAKKKDLPITSSAAEYLTYIAATGDSPQSFEMRYEKEKILAHAENDGITI